MQKKKKTAVPVHVIPEYRKEIDVNKICKALILAAKDRSRQSKDENNTDVQISKT